MEGIMSTDILDQSIIKAYSDAVRKERAKPSYPEANAAKIASEMMDNWRAKKLNTKNTWEQ